MPKALWNGSVIAEASENQIHVVEGNVYFPFNSVHPQFLQESDKTTVCSWKGTANYYHVIVDGKRNEDAAWTYRNPKDAAKQITAYIAFWRGVDVQR